MRFSLIRVVCRGVAVSLVAAPLLATPAFAADMTPQEKMSACAKQNKGKKGDDYKQSQSECLKNGPAVAAAAPMTPQQRMAMCSKQNKGKKGDEYKKAQSDCLKG